MTAILKSIGFLWGNTMGKFDVKLMRIKNFIFGWEKRQAYFKNVSSAIP